MKKFLLNAIVFVAVFAVINVLFYFFVARSSIFGTYIYNGANISDYNTFLVSDSHGALLGTIPDDYGIYNFSYKGDNYLDSYLKIEYLSQNLDISSHPTIFLGVDNYTLSKYRSLSENLERNLIYSGFNYKLVDSVSIHSIRSNPFKKYFTLFPFLDTNFGPFYLQSFNKSSSVPSAKYSFANLDEESKILRCRRRFNVQFPSPDRDEIQLLYLRKIISLCKKKGINLVGLKFPITKMYSDITEGRDYGAANELGANGFKTLNFENFFESQDDYFLDQDHLNGKGGDIFCKELKNKIKL